MTPTTSLWALPGPRLAEYAERITELSRANGVLAGFRQLRRQDVESGQTPTVKQSLHRLEAQA